MAILGWANKDAQIRRLSTLEVYNYMFKVSRTLLKKASNRYLPSLLEVQATIYSKGFPILVW